MADNPYELIGGTIIQRSFVASEFVNVINIATAPISEVTRELQSVGNSLFLHSLTAEILGVPEKVLINERQYTELIRVLRHPDFLRFMQTTNLGYTAPIYQAFYDQWYSRLAEVDS